MGGDKQLIFGHKPPKTQKQFSFLFWGGDFVLLEVGWLSLSAHQVDLTVAPPALSPENEALIMAYREHARAARVEAEFWQRTTFQLTGGAATGSGGASLSASPGGSAPAWGTLPQPTWAPPVPTWGPVATTGHLAQAGGGGGGAYPSPVGFPGPSQPMWTPLAPGPMWAAPVPTCPIRPHAG